MRQSCGSWSITCGWTGAPICSDRTGYFYPANAWEVIATIGHLRRMRDGVEKAIRSLERATGAFRLPGGGEADR